MFFFMLKKEGNMKKNLPVKFNSIVKKLIFFILILVSIPGMSIELPEEKSDGSLHQVWLSPNKSHLFCTYSENGIIAVFDTNSGEVIGKLEGHDKSPLVIAFSPDGTIAASGDYNGKIYLWDTVKLKKLKSLELDQKVKHIAISVDGKMLATCTTENIRDNRLSLKLWNISDRKFELSGSFSEMSQAEQSDTVHFDFSSIGRGYDKAFFSSDGKTLCAIKDYHIRIFLAIPAGLALIREFEGPHGHNNDQAYNTEDTIITAVKDTDKIEISLYNVSDGSLLKKKPLNLKSSAACVNISPDKKYIAVQFNDNSDQAYAISVYDTGSLKTKLSTTSSCYNFSQDDKFFLYRGDDIKTIVIQDIESKKIINTIKVLN